MARLGRAGFPAGQSRGEAAPPPGPGRAVRGRNGRYRWRVSERRWGGILLPGLGTPGDEKYPGERFGLPKEGPRSVSGMGRRLLALLIDWLLSLVIAHAFFGHSDVTVITLLIFAFQIWVLTALTGFTIGKRICGIRVARLDGRPVGFLWALVRTVLLLCVLPPLVTDRDLRGLHDRAANTIVLRV
jgi:RDD family